MKLSQQDGQEIREMVFYVEAADVIVNPIAICPQIEAEYILWNDTDIGYYGEYKKIEVKKESRRIQQIIITDKENHTIKLFPLTHDLFEKKEVAEKVADGRALLNYSDEELINYYKNTNFTGY